jgi:hypothetical protein
VVTNAPGQGKARRAVVTPEPQVVVNALPAVVDPSGFGARLALKRDALRSSLVRLVLDHVLT